MRRRAWPPLLMVVALAGCESWFAPEGIEVLGVIWRDDPAAPPELQYYPLVITLPDSVDAGQAFSVTVRTYLDCLESRGSTLVDVYDDTYPVGPFHSDARIIVRTRVRPARKNESCAGHFRSADHVANVAFTKWGTGTVRVTGEHRYNPIEGGYDRVSPIDISRSVVVRRPPP